VLQFGKGGYNQMTKTSSK